MSKYNILDNYLIKDMLTSLTVETTLSRYYVLIPLKEDLLKNLNEQNILDKEDFIHKFDYKKALRIKENEWKLFSYFINLNKFIPRKLKEVVGINEDLLLKLNEQGINSSGDLLLLQNDELIKFNNDPDFLKLYALCMLMRLPGVKSIRANLYYKAGYKSYNDFLNVDVQVIQNNIRKQCEENKWLESVPLYKEIATHQACAFILKHHDDFRKSNN